LFFADQDGTEHLRGTVEQLAEQADDALDQLATLAAGTLTFPERMRTNVLSMRLVSDVHQALADWADWAAGAVDVLEAGDVAALGPTSCGSSRWRASTPAPLPSRSP